MINMKAFQTIINTIALYIVIVFISGCAAQEAVRQDRYFWPPPPSDPRIEWLKTYSSQLDLDKSSSQLFWAAIAGDDHAIPMVKPVEVKSVPELNKFYVSDLGNGTVLVFDLGGRELRKLETPASVPAITHPLSIVVDRDNSIYILDRRSAAVFVFNRSEQYQRIIDLKALSILNPVTMGIDKAKGLLYVSDASSRKIAVLGIDGSYIKSVGSGGDGDGQFNLPIALAINSRGQLLVADAFNANVQIFDGEGRFVRKFGRRGDAIGDFQLIKSVAVDSNDNIYVVDGRSHAVTIYNDHGELLMSFGGYYAVAESGKVAPGGFAFPVAIDIDASDKIFIVDQMNARVQVFQYLSDAYMLRQRGK